MILRHTCFCHFEIYVDWLMWRYDEQVFFQVWDFFTYEYFQVLVSWNVMRERERERVRERERERVCMCTCPKQPVLTAAIIKVCTQCRSGCKRINCRINSVICFLFFSAMANCKTAISFYISVEHLNSHVSCELNNTV